VAKVKANPKESKSMQQQVVQQIAAPAAVIELSSLTKAELLRVFKKESPRRAKFKQFQLILEQKKVAKNLGLLRVEFYIDGKTEIAGGLYFPLTSTPEGQPKTTWDLLKVGKSQVFGLVVDSREQSLIEKFKALANRSLEEGKLQDLIPFASKK
jgi:hypothetical protein